jgi:hypothetical protein
MEDIFENANELVRREVALLTVNVERLMKALGSVLKNELKDMFLTFNIVKRKKKRKCFATTEDSMHIKTAVHRFATHTHTHTQFLHARSIHAKSQQANSWEYRKFTPAPGLDY